jgi:organic hydroperoxide reductase OsmC/OhrA
MANYEAQVVWERGDQAFVDQRYSRRHWLRFDGGLEVPGSSSPHVVPLPWSDPAAVDPEEAFIASISSCHMLWFLSLAAREGYCVDRYEDRASGTLAQNIAGQFAFAEVTLHPQVHFSGHLRPTTEAIHTLHHRAHEECFIANSVRCEVRCEPVIEDPL